MQYTNSSILEHVMEMEESVVSKLMIHARARVGLHESTAVVLPKVGMKRPRISISISLLAAPLACSFYHHIPHSLGTSRHFPLVAITSSKSDSSTSTPTLSPPYTEQPSISAKVKGGELLSLGFDGLGKVLGGHGRAKMVWNALAAGMDPFSDEGSGAFLTPKTVEILKHAVEELPWQVVSESVSRCGTRKLLIRLEDELDVETVVIPCLTGTRSTVCISSQVGCIRNCQFCMTGKMGLVRNLTAGEILAQVFFARRAVRLHKMPPLTNAVYMGMGEPLDNFSAVLSSLNILRHPHAFAMAKSKISVSTVGPSPSAIRRMAAMPSRLAWSVHAATDEVRRLLVPTTTYSMEELRDAFAEVFHARRREHLFVEVVLIRGVTDTPEMARALAALLRPLPTRASINLLPLNDTGHPSFRASTTEAVLAFRHVLLEEGFMATIRTARGGEKSSACGQLATSASGEQQRRERKCLQQ